uniref:Trichohyalin-plectin-homology domain-containing protein n=1 Tax=Trepomonas sp. PC1 TaxID=1076344 RepID=A0A146KE07_9EUKA|eukprot:JAP93681.1 Hypothetical protein TPC1_13945 [Trepomonas sp. PC1]
MMLLADPVKSKILPQTLSNQILSEMDVKATQASLNRAKHQLNAEDNIEARLAYLEAHKQKARDQTAELARAYEERIKKETDDLKQKQKSKLSQMSEFGLKLKSAKMAAECAKFENQVQDERFQQKQSLMKEKEDQKAFVNMAAQKEREYRSQLQKHYTDHKIDTANHQQKEIKRIQQLKDIQMQNKQIDMVCQKQIHDSYLADQQQQKLLLQKKMLQTREDYEYQLEQQKLIKEQLKLQEKAEQLEEAKTAESKDQLFQFAKEKQLQMQQNKILFQQKQQEKAQVSILAAQQEKDRKFKEMELATIDGQRKKDQLEKWNNHWQELAQETYLTQEIQMAQRNAQQVTDKIIDITQGRFVINAAETEQIAKKQSQIQQKQLKLQKAAEMEAELQQLKERRNEMKQTIKSENRLETTLQEEQLEKEKEQIRRVVEEENDPSVKKCYQKVLEKLEKQDRTVSWTTDIQ